jgi:hypothetical protein
MSRSQPRAWRRACIIHATTCRRPGGGPGRADARGERGARHRRRRTAGQLGEFTAGLRLVVEYDGDDPDPHEQWRDLASAPVADDEYRVVTPAD